MPDNEMTNNGSTPANAGKLIIDGAEYAPEQLSEEARNQITNLRATDIEIARIKQQLAITQTARAAYAAALKKALPTVPGTAPLH